MEGILFERGREENIKSFLDEEEALAYMFHELQKTVAMSKKTGLL